MKHYRILLSGKREDNDNMAFMKTNSVKITVNENTYDSLKDFGLAIENTDYIGAPVREEHVVYVPGRHGALDFADSVFGGPTFQYRPINIRFGGIEDPVNWDSVISAFRNLFEGYVVKLEFATDPGWYYIGRCSIDEFKHQRSLGTFNFLIEEADPFKHRNISISVETVITGITVIVPVTRQTVIPDIICTNSITVDYAGETFAFSNEVSRNKSFKLPAGNNTLVISGTGTVVINYLDGSL